MSDTPSSTIVVDCVDGTPARGGALRGGVTPDVPPGGGEYRGRGGRRK